MDILCPVCAGLDVHKQTVTACVGRHAGSGPARQQSRTFATTTAAVLELADWLAEVHCVDRIQTNSISDRLVSVHGNNWCPFIFPRT